MRRPLPTTKMPVRCAGSVAVAAVLVMLAGQRAAAQEAEPEPVPPLSGEALRREVAELVAALGSSDVRVRTAATAELRDRNDLTLAGLEAALADPALTPEQRRRLNGAALDRFLREPRAAMGVQWQPQANPSAVVLSLTLEGFHSSEVLKPGDRLEAIDDIPVSNDLRLRATIISHDPGDTVEVALVRAGEPMKVRVRLGSFDDLRNGPPPSPTFAVAWALRSERRGLRAPQGAIIDAGLAAEDWRGTPAQPREVAGGARLQGGGRLVATRPRPDDESDIVLVAGGEARAGVDGAWRDVGNRAQRFQLRVAPGVQVAEDPDVLRQRRQHLQVLQQSLLLIDEQINAVDQVIENPATAAALRVQQTQLRAELLRRRAEFEAMIRELQGLQP